MKTVLEKMDEVLAVARKTMPDEEYVFVLGIEDVRELRERAALFAHFTDALRMEYKGIEIKASLADSYIGMTARSNYDEAHKREPLLSDDHMALMFAHIGIGYDRYGRRVRDFYEDLIAKGVLIRAKP